MHGFNPYPGNAGREVDLRRELNKILMGGPGQIAKGQLVLLRYMRRAEDAPTVPTDDIHLIKCDCVDALYQEADKTYPCNICEGEGYLFDEFWVPAYKEERYEYIDTEDHRRYAKATVAISFFYIEFYRDLSRYDVIVEPQIDIEGNVISPVSIYRKHEIHMAQKMRSDNGRLEYWRVATSTD